MVNDMNENVSKKREWVKTAAIIFLSVMLVLTFFSQTIMNYSLPEVAAQYINSGSITAKVRGTGTIEAGDPYNVILNQTRKISSVAVKAGDKVEKDQLLFTLEDIESDELTAAEKALSELILAFETAILSGDISNSVFNNVQNDVSSTVAGYQTRITAAKNAVNDWTARVDELTKQISVADLSAEDTTAEQQALTNAEANLESAKSALANAQTALGNIETSLAAFEVSRDLAGAKNNADTLKVIADAKFPVMQAEETKIKDSSNKINALNTLKSAREAYDSDSSSENEAAFTSALAAVKALGIISLGDNPLVNEIDNALTAATNDYNAAVASYPTVKKEYEDALKTYQEAYNQYSLLTQLEPARVAVNQANTNVSNCTQAVTNATTALNNKKNNQTSNSTNLQKQKVEAQAQLDTANKNYEQLIKDIQAELSLGSQSDAIQEQRELVEKLREESVGTEITAPVAGTVTTINYAAGEDTKAENPLAVIQPDGKAFSLSFSVTADQAKRLSPGDPAEIQNAWYYSDLTATLATIKNDPQNPGKSMILVFNIEGDVTNGQSLSLAVGQKSANYDMIVPNSAIREDSNGKFILTVESKSSPLGNRYIATRVDVEVLASDDTQSAISGALYGGEFVITTSTKPVEAGKQVRLAE